MSGCTVRLCVLLLSTLTGLSQAQSVTKLVLTSQADGLEPETSFSCNGSIYGYLTLAESATGKHEMEGIWIMPSGKEKEHSKSTVDFGAEPSRTAQLWLGFQPETPGLSALMGSIPKPVSEPLYDGQWRLVVLWDHQILAKTSFQVKC